MTALCAIEMPPNNRHMQAVMFTTAAEIPHVRGIFLHRQCISD